MLDAFIFGAALFALGVWWPLSALLNGLTVEALLMLLGLLALCTVSAFAAMVFQKVF